MRTLGLVLGVVALSCVQLRADDARDIQGVWMPVRASLGVQNLPEETLRTMRLKIDGDKYEVVIGRQAERGQLKLDGSLKTKALDIICNEGPNKGKTILGIYELSGETLRVCYNLTGDKRPEEFKIQGESALFLVTYNRVK
jgi:uncharacterized protein (TIGR03067 family)